MVCQHEAHRQSTGISREFNNLSLATELKNRLSVDESDKRVTELMFFNLDKQTQFAVDIHHMIKVVLSSDDDDEGLRDDDDIRRVEERAANETPKMEEIDV